MIAQRREHEAPGDVASPRRRRAERDLALIALYQAGISSLEIPRIRLADVRSFPSGKVSVRLRRDEGLLRGARRSRYVVLDGAAANRVARHFEARAAVERSQPLFPGRRNGTPLADGVVRAIVREHRDLFDRRERS